MTEQFQPTTSNPTPPATPIDPKRETDATPFTLFGMADNLAGNFPNSRAAAWLAANSDAMAEKILDHIYDLPGMSERFRPEPERSKSLRDLRFHLSYLSEALSNQEPRLFLDYIEWVKVLFSGLDLGDRILTLTLESMSAVLKVHMPAEQWAVTQEILEMALAHVAEASGTVESFIQEEMPLSELSTRYLDALLQGERASASRMILDALESGQAGVRDLYLHVFQRSQHEIGRLWQTNQVSVAQEHYCTAATQLIMSQLYPHIFSSQRNNRKMIAASIGGELHEMGIRMVADFFEMEGWDTYYLGANTPEPTILQTVAEQKPDLLAISATITFNVRSVTQLIAALHDNPQTKPIKILVGGYPFNVSPTLWQRIGADGFAQDAQEATVEAAKLVGISHDRA